MDPLTLSLIAGIATTGANVYGTHTQKKIAEKNMYLTESQNRINRQVEAERYAQMRKDALSDWKAQNEYNHPLQQMQRLREAGLNPNLVYGKGADATADTIRSSTFTPSNAPAPQNLFNAKENFGAIGQGITQGINQIYDLKTKQAQTDNIAQSTALMQQEALFKQAGTAKTMADTATSKFELGKAQELKDSVIENQKLANEKLRADTSFTIDQNARNELANSSNVRLTLEKIITEKIAHAKDQASIDLLKEQLNALQQSQNISSYEEELSRMGIHKNDPWYFRAMMNLVNGNIDTPSPLKRAWNNFSEQGDNALKRLFNKPVGNSGKW